MRPAFAKPEALAEWLGEPIQEEADTKRAGRVLRAASNLVRAYCSRNWLDEDGNLTDDVPEEVVDVTLSCAARYYVNPNAETQWTKQIDDMMDGGGRKVESSGLYLTESERLQLDVVKKRASNTVGGVGSVATTRGDALGYEDPHGRFLCATVTG